VLGRGVELAEVAVAAREVAAVSAEAGKDQRHLAGLDALLQLGFLLLRQPAALDLLVDAVLQRVLQRVRKLARLDAELIRGVVNYRLALLTDVERALRGHCAGGADCHRERDCACYSGCELVLPRHRAPPSSWACAAANQRALRWR
jgi:hypothetical protein